MWLENYALTVLAVAVMVMVSPSSSPSQTAPIDSTHIQPDSLGRYVMDPIHSTASEMTLREIVSRSTQGEKTKLAGHKNMTYNITIRSILTWKKKREIRDEILLIYEDDSGMEKHIKLVEKVAKEKWKDDGWVREDNDREQGTAQVRVEANSRGHNLAYVPFFLRKQEDFDFTLLERTLDNDHVVFKIAFKPRSDFKPLPSGTVYIDADQFRVIHEEFTFDENPMPLLLKDVNRVSRQWTKLPGGQWVVSRMMGEMDLRGGFMGLLPDRVEVAVIFNDYRFDQGYDERRFGPYGG